MNFYWVFRRAKNIYTALGGLFIDLKLQFLIVQYCKSAILAICFRIALTFVFGTIICFDIDLHTDVHISWDSASLCVTHLEYCLFIKLLPTTRDALFCVVNTNKIKTLYQHYFMNNERETCVLLIQYTKCNKDIRRLKRLPKTIKLRVRFR